MYIFINFHSREPIQDIAADFHRYSHGTFRPLKQSKISQRLFGGDLIASVHLIVPPLCAISYPIVSVVLPTRRLAPTMKSSSVEEHGNRFARGGAGGICQDGIFHSSQSAINVGDPRVTDRLYRRIRLHDLSWTFYRCPRRSTRHVG